MASNLWFFDPTYDLECFMEDTFNTPLDPRLPTVFDTESSGSGVASRPIKPRMDIDLKENKEKKLVTATFELPGLQKEDVNIDIRNNCLTISGEAKKSFDEEEGGYSVHERKYGKFSRTLNLPHGVKEDQINSEMDHGVLRVQFPKATPEQVHKKIAIN